MMAGGVDNLDTRQVRDLADWLMYRLPMNLRHRLMGELPGIYAAMFPDVDSEIIAGYVGKSIADERRKQQLATADTLDAMLSTT